MVYIYDFTQFFWGPMLRLKYFRISFKYSQAHTWKGGEGGGHKDNNFSGLNLSNKKFISK